MSPHRARNNSLLTLLSALLLLVGIPLAGANTEKAIFLAPEAIHFPETTPSLDNLRLHTITHTRSSIRTSISVEFPAGEDDINGAESWYLLRTLKEGQRYEVRVCWAATQPTNFKLEVFDIQTAFDTPELVQSIAAYSEIRQKLPPLTPPVDNVEATLPEAVEESVLFLRIEAAADFYSTNETLMREPPPVTVDISE
ncbi:hypothetical protein MBLNU230_g8627t1 [Neophaeotheca triangularis]